MFGACEGGHKDIVKLLLKNGAYIDEEIGSYGYTLVFHALDC